MGEADRKPVKKKVLFLLEAFDKGGIEKVTLDIVNHLDPEKYDITVQTFWYGGHCQSLVHNNIRVIPFFFKRYVRGIIRLIQYLPPKLLYVLFVHGKYDVEIAASDGGAAKVISGSTNKKAKKVCWVHMDVVARGSKLKEFRDAETARKIYEKFDMVVPVSNGCMQKFKQKFGKNYTYRVVKNPMPVTEIWRKSMQPLRLPRIEGLNIVCIGRVVEQKGFDRLVTVCIQLVEAGYERFKIFIIGDGSQREQLECLMEKNDICKYVEFLGFQDNPYPFLKQADLFLLCSRDESFSLVVGESLIVGTPVIATDCSGVDEWLENEKYGILVENSADGIVRGIIKILEFPEILEHYRNVISEVREKISFDNAIAEFERIVM